MITPRATRLVRAAGAQAFRQAVVALACEGSPLDARDRLVIVPTRAAAAQLLRSIEDSGGADARILPDVITPPEIVARFAERLPLDRRTLAPAEREVLLAVACRRVQTAGVEPPFDVRPALVAEILAWYDELRRRQHNVDSFERLALGALEPGALDDRGAERLVRQTRFLVAAFREFERLVAEAGADEHALRAAVIATAAGRPIRHVVLTVADRSVDPRGLLAADWDLLSRVPALERLDIVVTDGRLAGALHECMHRLLPGIEEVRFDADPAAPPRLFVPSPDAALYTARDREDEVEGFARTVKHLVRHGSVAPERVALVVNQPLPYVYLTRSVLQSAGIPCQLFDALPLAAEPCAAALDLVLSCVSAGFSRTSVLALLRSPHFGFADDRTPVQAEDVALLEESLIAIGYNGDPAILDTFIEPPPDSEAVQDPGTVAAARAWRETVLSLRPLAAPAPAAEHLSTLISFVTTHERLPAADSPARERHLRARSAILGTMAALRDAYARFDPEPVAFDEVAALIRRWIDAQTFAPRSGEGGVHVLDAASAPFGSFDHVHVAGLVDGEWPDRQRRSIFYSAAILRDLGWSAESLRLDGARAAFTDLLTLPAASLSASTFLLEEDALVSASAFADDLGQAPLERVVLPLPATRIFDYEALALEPEPALPDDEEARRWTTLRVRPPAPAEEHRVPLPAISGPFSIGSLERYQDCPFRYFASAVLRLEEPPDDEDPLSPRARGLFVHELFQRFFEAWDERTGRAPIDVTVIEQARALFAEIAEALLARLGEADAALARARLFGSAISIGIVDTALAVEAAHPGEVRGRLLEYRFNGEFSLGASARRVRLKGVVDRVELLAGNRLRVIDYKTGAAPNPRRALQVPIYALCVQETLTRRDGERWTIDEGAYVALGAKRPFVPIVQGGGADAEATLDSAADRLLAVVDAIGRREFPPRPHDPLLCRSCAYPSVCRRDYVD